MDDLKQRFRSLDDIGTPDVWDRAVGRVPSQPAPAGRSGLRRATVAIVALAVAAAALYLPFRAFRGSPAPRPAIGRENGDIWAFGGGGEIGSSVYAVDPDSGEKRLLWTDGIDPNSPPGAVDPARVANDFAFSPDGTHVAFSHGLPGEHDEIFVMNADGTGLRQLTHDGAHDGFPAWSPDGTTIAYTQYRGNGYNPGCLGVFVLCPGDLLTIPADGGDPQQLTNDPADESMPAWSPDGRLIAFKFEDSHWDAIEVIGADGGPAQPPVLFHQAGLAVVGPAWAPDGSTILFVARPVPSHETWQVWSVGPRGENAQELFGPDQQIVGQRPVWSPDGTRFAYTVANHDHEELWAARPDGSGARRMTTVATGLFPMAWQPRLP